MEPHHHDGPSDATLWERSVAGDSEAFAALFKRHADAVYNHCFRRTGSWSHAEDLTSAVFLQAWRKRRQVVFTTDSVLPWLLAVANNSVRNQQRALRRYRRTLTVLPSAEDSPDFAEDAAARVDDEHAMRRVLASFEHLSDADKDVLSLVGWAGLSYADTAAVLGVPVGTVRSRLSRAREHLRELTSAHDNAVQPSSTPAQTHKAEGSRP